MASRPALAMNAAARAASIGHAPTSVWYSRYSALRSGQPSRLCLSLCRAQRVAACPLMSTDVEPLTSSGGVCGLYGHDEFSTVPVPLFRTLAMDADGKNQLYLGQKDTMEQMGMRLSDGKVVDWLKGDDGTVLMTRSYMPEQTTGKLLARKQEGLGVDLIDTRTGKVMQQLERPGRDVVEYLSDGVGNIRQPIPDPRLLDRERQ